MKFTIELDDSEVAALARDPEYGLKAYGDVVTVDQFSKLVGTFGKASVVDMVIRGGIVGEKPGPQPRLVLVGSILSLNARIPRT